MSNVIVSECIKYCLHLDKLLGQGFNGCSVMAGTHNGLQAKIREKYPEAAFIHCASHILNLLVNDLNDDPEICNAVDIIKKIIDFSVTARSEEHYCLMISLSYEKTYRRF